MTDPAAQHSVDAGRTQVADVSVVIPAHNAELTLEEAVRSALVQDPPPAEVVIVDDASSDGTAALAARLASEYPVVRVIAVEVNGGVSRARNAGVTAASSTWIAFLDADDVWLADKLAKQLRFADERPQLAMIGCWFEELFDDRPGAVRRELWWQSGLLIRRDVFESLRFDPSWRVSELPEFLARFDDEHLRDGVREPLMRYRMNTTGLAHQSFLTERLAWSLVHENTMRRRSGRDQVPFEQLRQWFREAHPLRRRIFLGLSWRGDLFLRRALIEASRGRFARTMAFGAAGAALNPRSVFRNWNRTRSVGPR